MPVTEDMLLWLAVAFATVAGGAGGFAALSRLAGGASGEAVAARPGDAVPPPTSAVLRLCWPMILTLAPALSGPGFANLRAYVAEPYTRAGRPGGLSDLHATACVVFAGLTAAAVLTVSLGILLGPLGLALGLLGLPGGVFAAVSSLKSQASIRTQRIEALLPYAIDLLVLMLRSGTSFNLALRQVVEDYADHPLGQELGQVVAEIDMGANRREALARLNDRLALDAMEILVDNITQAEELGWPLAETLERMADRLTSQRMLRAQSAAGRASVMIMLPSTLILVAVVLILFGPVIVRFLRGDYSL